MVDLISEKKDDWAKQYSFTGVMKGSALHYNAALANKYKRQLISMVKQMTEQTRRELEKLFRSSIGTEYFSEDASIASQAKIVTDKLTKKFNNLFARRAKSLAESMVNQSSESSSNALAKSLKEMSGGITIKTDITNSSINEIIKASVANNVTLIKSISAQYQEQVQNAVMRSITTGNGLADLIPFLKDREHITVRRAGLIATDQTRKVYSDLNVARNKALGIKKFEWIHSYGGREPRELHKSYNGKIFSYDDPPVIDPRTGERGFPGQAINCRCVARPVVQFDEGEQE